VDPVALVFEPAVKEIELGALARPVEAFDDAKKTLPLTLGTHEIGKHLDVLSTSWLCSAGLFPRLRTFFDVIR